MFPGKYFAKRHFPGRYFPPAGIFTPVTEVIEDCYLFTKKLKSTTFSVGKRVVEFIKQTVRE